MTSHEYSPQDALKLLLRKVKERDTELANALQVAIDAGKDIMESEAPADQRMQRKYRKTVRFSDKEAPSRCHEHSGSALYRTAVVR